MTITAIIIDQIIDQSIADRAEELYLTTMDLDLRLIEDDM